MFIDTHCDAISLQANIQRAKAGHGCVLLLISLFENMVSYCTIKKGKIPRLTKKLMPCPQICSQEADLNWLQTLRTNEPEWIQLH